MLMLVLGKGKTGSLVAQVARERGHSVRVLDFHENQGARALTAPTLAQIDVAIDFTNPEAAVENMRACLALGGRIVVGTTGWLDKLDEMKALAARKEGALVYGSNFSQGVQELFRLTGQLAKLDGFRFHIEETHHTAKLDAPSGTALSLKKVITDVRPDADVEIASKREGDHVGIHVVKARCETDVFELRHEALSRRAFAEGAVKAAEWVGSKKGVWDFRDIFDQV
ncbi:4-hydroxy-tetrahydrodipicolinate reductase [Acidicapsa dinghuensis]|uniref:4-hydroxy-tetrahydrodipicolinate reductase n=1 Tax=Acidicapsa dinghuensis TaxID=2218256 RepID=A0ABW1ECT3_9BACT|nr:dihydrodipicolinate reductase C-terminal domain-containing protein [Acidicapsa dinghuensis]